MRSGIKRSFFIKILFLGMAAAIVWALVRRDPDSVMGVRLITQAQAQALMDGLEERDPDAEKLAFNGGDVSYSWWDGIVYIPQSMKDGYWNGEIAVRSPREDTVYFLADAYFEDKKSALREAHIFSYLLVCGDHYETGRIVFTGLPTVNIRFENGELSFDEDTAASIQVIDPERRTGGNGVLTSECTVHLRGGSGSGGGEKKNYRISLLDARGNPKNENLLGIRSDDDWILNTMLSDGTRVRERTAYLLWERINALEEHPIYATQIEYVELFVNEEYRGLYALMPPIDRKMLQLEKGDILYRIYEEAPSAVYDTLAGRSELTQETEYDGERKVVAIKYPDAEAVPVSWEPLRIYTEGVLEGRGLAYLMENGMEVNRENLIDCHWFILMTGLFDNNWRNTFLIAESLGGGRYLYSRDIWDLDCSFGKEDDYGAEVEATDRLTIADDCAEPEYALLTAEYPETHARAAEKWRLWKENGIDDAQICAWIDASAAQLADSGAMERDRNRWPQYNVEFDLEEMKAWVQRRWEKIDAYMSEK